MQYKFYYNLKNELQIANEILFKLDWYAENGYKPAVPIRTNKKSSELEVKNAVKKDFILNEQKFTEVQKQLRKLIEKNRNELDIFFSTFDYKIPKKIKIYMTNYGPGGSYYLPDEIILLMRGSAHDMFRTIIHEIVHLIVEKPFVQKNKLTHWQKELLIDIICNSSLIKKVYGKNTIQKNDERLSENIIEKLKFKNKDSLDYKKFII